MRTKLRIFGFLAVANLLWNPLTSAAPMTSKSLKAVKTLKLRYVGTASWYGKQHHGQKTASGETYDMRQLMAAHRTLPLGTRLLVTNLRNGRTVEVRVNDRGPIATGRIIDLSYAAAEELGALSEGVFPVRIRVVATPAR